MRFFYSLTVILGICLLAFSCQSPSPTSTSEPVSKTAENPVRDLSHIRKSGKLVALTDNSSTSYFIYRGQPMGYEYELLQMYADEVGLELEMVVVDDLDNIFSQLNEWDGDIVAANMTITSERLEKVEFSEEHIMARQVLVQRLPENWRKMRQHKIENSLIRNTVDLAGKKVHVRKNSSFYDRLINLSEEIGGGIEVVTVPGDIETEELIRQVANGEIDYTIADENVALLNRKYHPNIDVETAISFPQKIAWAVRKDSPELLESLNNWIIANRNRNDYITVYNKYFRSSTAQKKRLESPFSSILGDQISQYDETIKSECEPHAWDWRLIASIIYQESKFDANAQAWTGASGLMQIMPDVGDKYEVCDLFNPEDNIRLGIGYLARLDKYWAPKVPNASERIKFVLGSYNVGLGHIIDARRLAEKNGADKAIWDENVGFYLLQKSKPKFYTDPVVRHGYCRGREPYNYVKKVLRLYDHYKNTIPLT